MWGLRPPLQFAGFLVGRGGLDPPKRVLRKLLNGLGGCQRRSYTRSSASSYIRLSYLTVNKFRIVVETRLNRLRIVRNRCVPVCGYRAGYFKLGLAQL